MLSPDQFETYQIKSIRLLIILDLTKAFDRVKRSYLLHIATKFPRLESIYQLKFRSLTLYLVAHLYCLMRVVFLRVALWTLFYCAFSWTISAIHLSFSNFVCMLMTLVFSIHKKNIYELNDRLNLELTKINCSFFNEIPVFLFKPQLIICVVLHNYFELLLVP